MEPRSAELTQHQVVLDPPFRCSVAPLIQMFQDEHAQQYLHRRRVSPMHQRQAIYRFDFWGRIEIMHLSASIGTGKAPMDPTVPGIALSRQDHNVLPQMIEALDPFGQTPSFKNADLDLGHSEPTSMFGRVMHLQVVPD